MRAVTPARVDKSVTAGLDRDIDELTRRDLAERHRAVGEDEPER